ncbi:SDR family NAD(P)-dependent oxidoreductase [Streptomyces sp. NPDC001276]|uniref:SDR family NAD(P)-dependent oxidoreductase n=1 Tax=Streptomyces sp. NPDC001276 TaxID=3364555 RepID=UPI0036AEC3C2
MSTETQDRKVAVITGASQGIGAGLVNAYRKLGHAIVATSRTIAPADDAGVLTVRGDIADPATAERVIAAAVERFGRVDTLVNNAGVFVAKPFTDYTVQDYAAVSGINLTGFFRLTQLAVGQMLAQGGGHIVTITTSLVDNADARVPSVLASLTKGGPCPSLTPGFGKYRGELLALVPQRATFAPSRRPARSPELFEQGGPPLAAPAESPSTSSTRTSGRHSPKLFEQGVPPEHAPDAAP